MGDELGKIYDHEQQQQQQQQQQLDCGSACSATEPPAVQELAKPGVAPPDWEADCATLKGDAAPGAPGEEEVCEVPEPEYGAGFSSRPGDCDPSRDVILRVEFAESREVRALLLLMYAALAAGVAALVALLVLLLEVDNVGMNGKNWFFIFMLVCSCSILLVMLVLVVRFTGAVVASRRAGRQWSPRRVAWSAPAYVLLLSAAWSVFWWMLPNAYILTDFCNYFAELLVWCSMLKLLGRITGVLALVWMLHNTNISSPGFWPRLARRVTGRKAAKREGPDVLTMDCPLWVHWPEIVVWLAMVAVVIAKTLTSAGLKNPPRVVWRSTPPPEGVTEAQFWWKPGQDCSDFAWDCSAHTSAEKVLKFVFFGLQMILGLLAIGYWLRGAAQMRRRPYCSYRLPNVLLELQGRTTMLGLIFLGATLISLDWTNSDSCTSYIVCLTFGLLPMEVVLAAIVVVTSVLFMPKPPRQNPLIQAHLSAFSFTDADRPRLVAERNAAAGSAAGGSGIEGEPMFSFERALRCLFWSKAVYAEPGEESSPFDVKTGLRLFPGLSSISDIRDPKTHSRALAAWGGGKALLAFRGTVSATNALHDIQALQTPLVPATAPRAHIGFLNSWRGTGGAFADSCLAAVHRAADEAGLPLAELEVVITGHSLGGAIATLAARELAARGFSRVSVYTFGAPRVGNLALKRELARLLPDLWNLTNDRDIVSHRGNLLYLYARPDNRVLLTRSGDVLVRPTVLEHRITIGGSSLEDHLLASYERAVVAAAAAQFTRKRFAGGAEGVLAIAEGCPILDEAFFRRHGFHPAKVAAGSPEERWRAYLQLANWRSSKQLCAWCGGDDDVERGCGCWHACAC